MKPGPLILLVTFLAVAGLLVWLTVLRWDEANKIATAASALGAVAAVGVAIWAALRTPGSRGRIRVSGTGKATATGAGSANTGFRGKAGADAEARDTGEAKASGGESNTGIRLD